MNQNEFNDWLEYHSSYYPGINTWIIRQDRPADILRIWSGTLARIHIDDAKKASDELYLQQNQPAAYERHPAIIRNRCATQTADQAQDAAAYARYGQTFKCRECRDFGWVAVRLQEPIRSKAITGYGEAKADRMSQSVVCSCEAGDKIAQCKDVKSPIRFNSAMMTNLNPLVESPPASESDWLKVRKLMKYEIGHPVTEPTAREIFGPGADG